MSAGAGAAAWTPAHSAALLGSPVLGINFHHIPADSRGDVTRQLRRASRLGDSFRLDDHLAPGPAGRPRIMVAFYDGYRETSLFGAEVCHELGVRAFFFPLLRASRAYPGVGHRTGVHAQPPEVPGRATLTEDDLQQISLVHEIAFHTATHVRADEVTEDNVRAEVIAPTSLIVEVTGRAPGVGAWRGGTRFDERDLGNRALRSAGVRFLVSNWSVEVVPPASATAG